MKSFKNHYNRSKTLPILQNSSFENPLLLTNSYTYYNLFYQSQKDSFVCICGGNDAEKNAGPSLVNGINGWNLLNPFRWQSMYCITIYIVYSAIDFF